MIDSHEPNVYQKVQADQIALLLAHRSGATERQLIQRMIRNRELVQRQISDHLDAVQLDLLGES